MALQATGAEVWVLHSSVDFAKSKLDAAPESISAELLAELERVISCTLPKLQSVQSHRWLYARPLQSLPETALWDAPTGLGACGDWCGGPRVEGAMLSGLALAGKILGSLHDRSTSTNAGLAEYSVTRHRHCQVAVK